MPVQEQIINISLAKGIDQKSDAKIVGDTHLLNLENAVFDETGAVKKRNGYTKKGTTAYGHYKQASSLGDITSGKAIYADGKKLYLSAGHDHTIDSYSQFAYDSQADQFNFIGREFREIDLSVDTYVRPDSVVTQPCIRIVNGYIFIVYLKTDTSGNLSQPHCSIFNETDGTPIIIDWVLGFSTSFTWGQLCVDVLGDFVLIAAKSSGSSAWIYSIDSSDLTNALNRSSTSVLDARPCTFISTVKAAAADGTEIVIFAYQYTAGSFIRYMTYYVSGGNIVSDGAFDPLINISAVNCFCVESLPSNKILFIWQDNSDGKLYYSIVQHTLGATPSKLVDGVELDANNTGETAEHITACYSAYDTASTAWNEDVFRYFVQYSDAQTYGRFVSTNCGTIDGTGNKTTNEYKMLHVGLASRSKSINGIPYVMTVHSSIYQSTYFLKSVYQNTDSASTDPQECIHAKALATIAGGLRPANGLCDMELKTDGSYCVAAQRQDRIASDGVVIRSIVGINFDFDEKGQTIQLKNGLLRTGGITAFIDSQYQEFNAGHVYPENFSLAAGATGGSMSDGTYYFKLFIEWTDRFGEIHRSAVSDPVSITLSAGTSVQKVTATCYTPLQRSLINTLSTDVDSGPAQLHLCRTTAADNETYYKDASADIVMTAETTAIESTQTDANLANNELLYTDSGEIVNDYPPASSAACVSGNRIWLVQADNRTRLWYSKIKSNALGYSFNSGNVKDVVSGGAITGLADSGGKLIIFKEKEIRYINSTNGPNNFGQGDFGEDYQITNDVGCTSRDSIVDFNQGIMFQSKKGIYLLNSAMQVQYIGAPVEDYNSETVKQAVLVASKNQVRLIMSSGDILVYDYYNGFWSIFKNLSAIDACIHDDTFTILKANGNVLSEDSSYTDDTTSIQMIIETAWIKPAGFQGISYIEMAIITGAYKSAHTLNWSVYYDYVDTPIETNTKEITADAAPYEYRLQPAKHECRAIKHKFYDTLPGGTEQSFTLSILSMIVSTERGAGLFADAQSM